VQRGGKRKETAEKENRGSKGEKGKTERKRWRGEVETEGEERKF